MKRVCSIVVAGVLWVTACTFDTSGAGGTAGGGGDAGDDGAGGDGSDGTVGGGSEPDAALPVERPDSCAAVLAAEADAASDVYELDGGDGGALFSAFCEMDTSGGGWTLALKADGVSDRFHWDAPYWTTTELYAANDPDHDRNEAKLDSFNRLPVAEVLIWFETDTDDGLRLRWVRFSVTGDSLLEIFQRPVRTPISLGRELWLDAVPGSELQEDCSREGMNVGPTYNRVRIGIVGDNDSNCQSADSKLGVGGSLDCEECSACEEGPGLSGPAVGNNNAGCSKIESFAAVFVR